MTDAIFIQCRPWTLVKATCTTAWTITLHGQVHRCSVKACRAFLPAVDICCKDKCNRSRLLSMEVQPVHKCLLRPHSELNQVVSGSTQAHIQAPTQGSVTQRTNNHVTTIKIRYTSSSPPHHTLPNSIRISFLCLAFTQTPSQSSSHLSCRKGHTALGPAPHLAWWSGTGRVCQTPGGTCAGPK